MKPRPETLLSALLYLALPGALLAQQADTGIAPPANLDTSAKAAVLKYEMKVGKTFDVGMDIAQQMQMMGQNVDTKIMMGMSMAVTDGGSEAAKKVATQYTRVGMDMNMMGQSMKYDSADGDDTGNPLASMGDMVGHEFTMWMDENSTVTSVTGLDDLKAAMSGGNPMLAGQMDSFLNEEQMKQLSNEWVSQVLPKEAVKPGDDWDFAYNMNVSGMGNLAYKGTATLLGYSKVDGAEVGVIDLDGVIDAEVSDAEATGPMAALGMGLSGGTSRSIIYWDNDLGYVRKMDADQTMKLSMKNPQTGEEMTMPINQVINMTVGVK